MPLDPSVVAAAERISFTELGAFPRVVAMLTEVGVERYWADLARMEQTLYDAVGGSVSTQWPQAAAPIAAEYDEARLRAAIRGAQQSTLLYPDFLREIAAAGVAAYLVSFVGRRVVYFSRCGDCWTEHFPQ